jgi:hypothetical protein
MRNCVQARSKQNADGSMESFNHCDDMLVHKSYCTRGPTTQGSNDTRVPRPRIHIRPLMPL